MQSGYTVLYLCNSALIMEFSLGLKLIFGLLLLDFKHQPLYLQPLLSLVVACFITLANTGVSFCHNVYIKINNYLILQLIGWGRWIPPYGRQANHHSHLFTPPRAGQEGWCPTSPRQRYLMCSPKLGDMDSNHDSHLQRVVSYHQTIPQLWRAT